jgi:hypothetical protein
MGRTDLHPFAITLSLEYYLLFGGKEIQFLVITISDVRGPRALGVFAR